MTRPLLYNAHGCGTQSLTVWSSVSETLAFKALDLRLTTLRSSRVIAATLPEGKPIHQQNPMNAGIIHIHRSLETSFLDAGVYISHV